MAFLNNSGDIILDAVLTDLGRKRLSQGDGSFQITQFALGDDEIDYSQYNTATGSAYTDLDILQTPVLEAITDNMASMKSKLVTYSRTDLLYLPIMAINLDGEQPSYNTSSIGTFVGLINPKNDFSHTGTFYGYNANPQTVKSAALLAGNFQARGGNKTKTAITICQGLDTTEISPTVALDPNLTEDVYFAYFDHRLGVLTDGTSGAPLKPSFIDDDNIATYVLTLSETPENFMTLDETDTTSTNVSSNNIIRGPYNRQALRFSIFASDNLAYSDFLFEKFGNTSDTTDDDYSLVYNIDTEVRIVGAKTGYTLSVPVRLVKVKTM